MRKDFIVTRSITDIEGKPHVCTISEQELIRCKDCMYATRHCCDSVFGEPLYDCKHTRQIGRECEETHPGKWFCADGVKRDG